MNTTLKFDRVVLTKELNEKFKQVGDVFEVASVLDNSFLLRDSRTRVALGVVSFEDFERCFVPEEKRSGWTPWTQFIGFDGQNDASYRTNGKKVQVRFLTSKIRAEACCCKDDEFNLAFGLRVAYLRCLNKALAEKKFAAEREIAENENVLKKMINSIGA
jgi:hypothetical protein